MPRPNYRHNEPRASKRRPDSEGQSDIHSGYRGGGASINHIRSSVRSRMSSVSNRQSKSYVSRTRHSRSALRSPPVVSNYNRGSKSYNEPSQFAAQPSSLSSMPCMVANTTAHVNTSGMFRDNSHRSKQNNNARDGRRYQSGNHRSSPFQNLDRHENTHRHNPSLISNHNQMYQNTSSTSAATAPTFVGAAISSAAPFATATFSYNSATKELNSHGFWPHPAYAIPNFIQGAAPQTNTGTPGSGGVLMTAIQNTQSTDKTISQSSKLKRKRKIARRSSSTRYSSCSSTSTSRSSTYSGSSFSNSSYSNSDSSSSVSVSSTGFCSSDCSCCDDNRSSCSHTTCSSATGKTSSNKSGTSSHSTKRKLSVKRSNRKRNTRSNRHVKNKRHNNPDASIKKLADINDNPSLPVIENAGSTVDMSCGQTRPSVDQPLTLDEQSSIEHLKESKDSTVRTDCSKNDSMNDGCEQDNEDEELRALERRRQEILSKLAELETSDSQTNENHVQSVNAE